MSHRTRKSTNEEEVGQSNLRNRYTVSPTYLCYTC